MRGSLVLEDGTVVQGDFFGECKPAFGELVFNTNMTGYCEALTDPSYRGQILMMTYPLIGNYGVDPATLESEEIQVRGFVVREACRVPSHPSSKMGLDDFLRKYSIPGISGVDTRQLTIKTRERGTMRAAIGKEDADVDSLLRMVKETPFPDSDNLVAEVSCKRPAAHKGNGPLRFVLIDCGVKSNIIREALSFGDVIQVPFDTPSDDVLRNHPDAVIVSNGPGNPAHLEILATTVKTIRELLNRVPVMGICLGHQMIGLALGGKTFKLKFGHRGGNQPVKDLRTGRVHITSQNHGFAVDAKSLERTGAVVTHLNLNDNTVEGISHEEMSVFSVQYHPEASPGPWDNKYIFAEFARLAGRSRHATPR
jgi:carbamoyl-phosphate synthase small subunit